ncbi:MAG TPA: HD-GYP domain-containing protein [Pyrinomonadaceae bacterium]|nr:HD-GYP domain-containing protein [Pyrinomonadaceae bacterium]
MQEELTMSSLGAATVRLVDASWGAYLQRAFASLKAAGERRRTDGVHALVGRLRRTRPSTYEHCVRVARYSRMAGRALGMEEARLRQLSSTAMMHDIGKILVPESILSRPRRPTRAERFILHLHPNLGALLASYFGLPAELRIRTQHHHERWDGRGYPHRLGGEEIPFMARIVQVADTYDAMVAQRAYNSPRTHEEAVAELRRESGTQFDPLMVEAFLDSFPERSGAA